MVDIALDELGDDTHRHRLHFRGRHERQRVDELVPGQREREYARRDETGDRERQDDLDQDLQAGRAVDQRAFLELERDRLEIPHQEPRAERDQERRVREDQREARVEELQLVDDRGQRDEQDRRRDEIGEENAHADVTRAAESQAFDRVGGEHAREQRNERRHHRDEDRVPEPVRVGGVEQQFLDVRERRILDPERIALARQQFLVRLEGRDDHPVEREEQDDQESRQRHVDGNDASRQRHEIIHPLRRIAVGFCAH